MPGFHFLIFRASCPGAANVAQLLEHSLNMSEALNSIPCTENKQTNVWFVYIILSLRR